MIRFIGQSLCMATVAVLFGTGAALTVARGQNGFVDDDSHVPPRPSASGYSAYSEQASAAIEYTPPATVTGPPQSTATTQQPAPYTMTPVPSSTRSIRTMMAPPGQYGAGQKMTPKIGPYGIGGKRPDPNAPDTTRRVTPVSHSATNTPTPAAAANTGKTTNSVKPASFFDETADPGFRPSVPPPVPPEGTVVPSPLFNRHAAPLLAPGPSYPTDRMRPPTIMGSHLGLQPGETATERSLRLMTTLGDYEHQLEGLGQRNAELNQLVKQRDDQLLLAIREIKSTRKEVQSARDELEHLRLQVKALQDKVHSADRDNAALIQTIAPLLQKLLETDGNPSPGIEE